MRFLIAMATALLVVCAQVVMCGPVHAEVYLGGGVLSSSYPYSDVSSGTGSKLFLGYRIDGFPVMFEAAHVDFGKPQIGNFTQGGLTVTDGTLGFTGGNYSVGYFGSQPQIRLGYWGKVGYFDGTSTLKGTGSTNGSSGSFDIHEKSGGFSWGLGVQYMFTPYFGALIDLEAYEGVKDVPRSGSTSEVTTVSGGLVLAFPPFRETPAPARRHHEVRRELPRQIPPPAVVPQAVAPAPAPTSVPAVQALPAAATPGGLVAGTQARLKAGKLLRSRASADGDVVQGVDAGAAVTLKVVLKKDTGAWWYVDSPGGSGWILDTDLEALP